jgi:hypothetical protein
MVERGYDVGVPPSTFDRETTNTTRLVIDMQLELMGIIQVCEEEGTVTFKAEFNQWCTIHDCHGIKTILAVSNTFGA